jgi:hypothetical protein
MKASSSTAGGSHSFEVHILCSERQEICLFNMLLSEPLVEDTLDSRDD